MLNILFGYVVILACGLGKIPQIRTVVKTRVIQGLSISGILLDIYWFVANIHIVKFSFTISVMVWVQDSLFMNPTQFWTFLSILCLSYRMLSYFSSLDMFQTTFFSLSLLWMHSQYSSILWLWEFFQSIWSSVLW